MISRYKNKAFIGIGVWIAVIPLLFLAMHVENRGAPGGPSRNSGLGAFLGFLIVQYLSFFWGGANLAKSKGYSTGILIYGIVWALQPVVLAVLLFALADKFARTKPPAPKHRHGESTIARIVRYRRNALVYNSLGIAAILFAVACISFPVRLIHYSENIRILGIFAFVAGYSTTIYGCWWWVRAKGWHEAVILIGLSPLVPLAFPIFRTLYLLSGVLPFLMVIMPLLMISVVAVLRDKSGLPVRKR